MGASAMQGVSSASFKDLDDRIKRARAKQAPGSGASGASSFGQALRIGAELVSGLIVGVAIGWGLDAWFGTKPWLMIAFFFLGAAAGILNVYRSTKGYGLAVGYRKPSDGTDDTKTPD